MASGHAVLNGSEYSFVLSVDGIILGLRTSVKRFSLFSTAVGSRPKLRGAESYDRVRHIDRLRIQPNHLVRHHSNEMRGEDARHPDIMKVLRVEPGVETFGKSLVIAAEALGEPTAIDTITLAAGHHGY